MPPPPYFLGLIGHPLSHSRSPTLHNAALKSVGVDGEYRLYSIPPFPKGELTLQDLLAQMRHGEIHGLNVTVPHKQHVIPYIDQLTPTAQAIGAVNTIIAEGENLIGDNTDAPGFLADLYQVFPALEELAVHGQRSALLFGAGGSARAVTYALLQTGWHITIAARRLEQVQILAADLWQHANTNYQLPITNHQSPIVPLSLTPTALIPLSPTLIVNTTPLGMSPNIDASPWPAELPFPKTAAVYDLVYNPLETTFVRAARAAGVSATTGLGMLIEQAALAFERWTGQRAPRDIMRSVISK